MQAGEILVFLFLMKKSVMVTLVVSGALLTGCDNQNQRQVRRHDDYWSQGLPPDPAANPVAAKVGDRYVLEEMLERGAILGGEQSGHIIFHDRATTGDGLLTAVRFLTMARRAGKSVAEFAATMQKFPQVLENVQVSWKEALEDAEEVWEAVRAAEADLDGSGRVLVRASGTEQVVRVMVEAGSREEAVRHARAVAAAVRSSLG